MSNNKKPSQGSLEPKRSPSDYAALIAKRSTQIHTKDIPHTTAVLDLPPIRSTNQRTISSQELSNSQSSGYNNNYGSGNSNNGGYTVAQTTLILPHQLRGRGYNASLPRPIPRLPQPMQVLPRVSSIASSTISMTRFGSPKSSAGLPTFATPAQSTTAISSASVIQIYSGPLDARAQKTPSIRTAATLPSSERALVLSASAEQQSTLQAYNLDLAKETRIFMQTSKHRRKAFNISKSMTAAADKVRSSGGAGTGAIVQEMQKTFGRPTASQSLSHTTESRLSNSRPAASSNLITNPTKMPLDWERVRTRWLCRWLQKDDVPTCDSSSERFSWIMSERSESKLFTLLRNSPNTTLSSLSFLSFLLKHGPDVGEWPKGFTVPYQQFHNQGVGKIPHKAHQSGHDEPKEKSMSEIDVKIDQESASESTLPICPICLDYFRPNSPQLLLTCSHSFHAVCLDSFERFTCASALQNGDPEDYHKCPECREPNYASIRVYDGALLTGFYFILRIQARFRGISVRRTLRKALGESNGSSISGDAHRFRRSAFFFKKLESISDRMKKFIEDRSEQVQSVIDVVDNVLSQNKAIISAIEDREVQIRALKRGSMHSIPGKTSEEQKTTPQMQIADDKGSCSTKCFVCLKPMAAIVHLIASIEHPTSKGVATLPHQGYTVHPHCATALRRFMSQSDK